MPDWENLDEFLDVGEFADRGTLRLESGEVRPVVGIFDEPFLDAQLGEYQLDTTAPRFMAKERDLVGVTRGDRITVKGRGYDIMSHPQIDGTGLATLRLAPEAPRR